MQDVENVYQDAYNKTKCLEGLFIHDISNLFQIISNSIELCGSLLKEEIKKEDFQEYFQLISQQLLRGKKLIRNVRNLADLENFEIVLEPVEVFFELRDAVNFTLLSFPNREIKVKFVSDFENLYSLANELLSEVFENIIINAIKYNKQKVAQIEIIVSKIDINSGNFVKIEFKDNGIGIKDDRKNSIFQEVHLKRRNSNGMGIGLSLVAKLIDLYGGEIRVENRIGGDTTKGSNFIILIPFAKKDR
ncbi:MAG: HAMP domain-containing histidine kinase [Candidatus Lokiarchaeota archaeon]|nr:HAMP domain-containing histidine kinase [Candidatus Lokiarchaeota archaeon]